jgi:hypothetical protein
MSSSGPLAERNHQERAAYIRRPSRTVSGLKRDVEIQNLAAVTLLDALDCDDRPSFAIEVPACPTYNDPLELIYSNAALRAASLLAKVSGQDATSVFIEGSAPQLAFRNWVYGHVDKIDLQRRGNAYTFEGHIWNAVTVGRSKIVTGMPRRGEGATALYAIGRRHRTNIASTHRPPRLCHPLYGHQATLLKARRTPAVPKPR